MRVDGSARVVLRRRVRLDHVERTGRAPTRRRVHQDGRVVAVEQRVGEVQPTDPEIDDAHALRLQAFVQSAHDLDPEAVVAEEHVADAGHEDAAPAHDNRSTSSGLKKKRCPGRPSAPRSWPGSSSMVTARKTRPS